MAGRSGLSDGHRTLELVPLGAAAELRLGLRPRGHRPQGTPCPQGRRPRLRQAEDVEQPPPTPDAPEDVQP